MSDTEQKKPAADTPPAATAIDDADLDQVSGAGDINPQPLPPRVPRPKAM